MIPGMRHPSEEGKTLEATPEPANETIEKLVYSPPALTVLGNVAELLSGAVGSADDFGEERAFTA